MSTDQSAPQTVDEPVSQPAENTANAGTYVPGEDAPQQHGQSDDTESRARAMGWVPKENYRGNPDNWKEADEFVRRGEEILPIVQERNRDLVRKLSEVETRLAAQEASYKTGLERLEHMSSLALQRQREQLLGGYDGAMRQAAASADVERYDQLQRDRYEAVKDFDTRVQQSVQQRPAAPAQPAQQPEVKEWIDRNSTWFKPGTALQMEAAAIHQALLDEHPYMPMADNLKRVEQTIKQRYPQKFGMQPPQQSTVSYGSVEGGGSRMSSGSRQKGVADLPSDAKIQGEKFVKQGYFRDLAEYARDYHAQG